MTVWLAWLVLSQQAGKLTLCSPGSSLLLRLCPPRVPLGTEMTDVSPCSNGKPCVYLSGPDRGHTAQGSRRALETTNFRFQTWECFNSEKIALRNIVPVWSNIKLCREPMCPMVSRVQNLNCALCENLIFSYIKSCKYHKRKTKEHDEIIRQEQIQMSNEPMKDIRLHPHQILALSRHPRGSVGAGYL